MLKSIFNLHFSISTTERLINMTLLVQEYVWLLKTYVILKVWVGTSTQSWGKGKV